MLDNHMTQHKTDENAWCCPACGGTGRSISSLDTTPHVCPVCGVSFTHGDFTVRIEGVSHEVEAVSRKLLTHLGVSKTNRSHTIQEDLIMDPLTVITSISAGLDLVDRFRSMALSFLKKKENPPSVEAKQSGNTIEIKVNGHVTDCISADALRMTEWDDVRYTSLNTKVKKYWKQFNSIDVALASAAPDEKARLEEKMDEIRVELCKSFREMIHIYEATLGIQLGDHYSLYSVCGIDCPM